MKAELILLLGGSIVAGLLYAGLPEHATMRGHDVPAIDTDSHGIVTEPEAEAIPLEELEKLRQQQATLAGELRLIDQRLHAAGVRPAARGAVHTDEDDSPGLTVYLETTEIRPGTSPSGQQWTALRFRDAGTAPDGSHQAVMSLHPGLAVSTSYPSPSTGVYRVDGARWQ